jgi:hypothetical protein
MKPERAGWDTKGLQAWAMSRFKRELVAGADQADDGGEVEEQLRDAAVETGQQARHERLMKFLEVNYCRATN